MSGAMTNITLLRCNLQYIAHLANIGATKLIRLMFTESMETLKAAMESLEQLCLSEEEGNLLHASLAKLSKMIAQESPKSHMVTVSNNPEKSLPFTLHQFDTSMVFEKSFDLIGDHIMCTQHSSKVTVVTINPCDMEYSESEQALLSAIILYNMGTVHLLKSMLPPEERTPTEISVAYPKSTSTAQKMFLLAHNMLNVLRADIMQDDPQALRIQGVSLIVLKSLVEVSAIVGDTVVHANFIQQLDSAKADWRDLSHFWSILFQDPKVRSETARAA